jgi:hypothetical protein
MSSLRKPTRRQVLRGAGGFTLALPWLPSLLPRGAEARTSPLAQPRFVAICTEHGAIWPQNMFPADDTLTETMSYAGHTIRRGDLVRTESGDIATISPVLSGNATDLTPELVAKMNVIRGLDIPFYIAHHRGGHLGNFAANDGNGSDGVVQQGNPTPTIDQVLAWSGSFYSDLSTILERTLVIGHDISWGWSNPQSQSGQIQALPVEWSSLALFNRIFVPEEEEENPRPPVVDRVMENYQSLLQSNRRLSAMDRQRLEEHVTRIDELQRRLAVAVSCGDIPVPTQSSTDLWGDSSFGVNPPLQREFWQLFNDVVTAAFVCGTSRIAVLRVTDTFSDFVGDWHQDIAHQAHLPDGAAQQQLADANHRSFQDVFLDLVRKLDIDEGDGTTILDNCLVQWTQESGPMTHESIDTTVVTAGGASGCLVTGQYIDYRNQNSSFGEPFEGTPVQLFSGLCYQQWLGTALQAMGLDPLEFAPPGQEGGYPDLYIGEGREGLYPSSVTDVRSEWLPWLRGA